MAAYVLDDLTDVSVEATYIDPASSKEYKWVLLIDELNNPNNPVVVSFWKTPLEVFFTQNSLGKWVINVEEMSSPLWRENDKHTLIRSIRDDMWYTFAVETLPGPTNSVSIRAGADDVGMLYATVIGPGLADDQAIILLVLPGCEPGIIAHEWHVSLRA